MAGYLFSLNNIDSLTDCIDKGVYSTRLSSPLNNLWKIHHEGTFADYCSMKEGDNVYFFIDRKIYGIGSLININGESKYLNYPTSNEPTIQYYQDIQNNLLLRYNDEDSVNYRFICSFIPSPSFFKTGVDMDELLSSAPNQFKILPAFWKKSFIKFSDEENQAFKNILLRRNVDSIGNPNEQNIIQTHYMEYHEEIRRKTHNNSNYKLSIEPFLTTTTNENGSIRHEMAIEAALIYQLSISHTPTIEIFGEWDYISHQVIASPFKPIDYMDKMDIFGYKYIRSQAPTVEKYLIIEIKKDTVVKQDILQLMKYVDWIKNEYAYGEYNMIDAFMVAYDYTDEAIQTLSEMVERRFIYGVRPSNSGEWRNVKLIKYIFNVDDKLLDFEIKANANINQ